MAHPIINNQLSIGFMGTPELSHSILEFILSLTSQPQMISGQSTTLELKAVWTNAAKPVGRGQTVKKSPVEILAEERNISCFTPEKITSLDSDPIKELGIDMIFVVAYGKILPEFFFTTPRLGCYNLHFSLLPKYRGASPLQSAILQHDTVGGITYQAIAKKMDTGNIYLQNSFDITNLSTAEYLQKSVALAKKTFIEFLNKVIDQEFTAQDELLVSYCKKIDKCDGLIKPDDSIKTIYHKYLAYQDWPGIYLICDNIKYELTELGQLESINQTDESVAKKNLSWTKEGCKLFLNHLYERIEIKKIKKQGKNELSTKDFLNGSNLKFPIYFPFASQRKQNKLNLSLND